MRKKLTEKVVQRLLKRVPTKGRQTYWDMLLPGFGLRVSHTGARTYGIGGRFGNGAYRWRALGDARVMRFDDAKAKARAWLDLAANGKDPKIAEAEKAAVEAAKKREEERRRGHTLEIVADTYLSERVIGPNEKRPLQRKWREVKRHINILKVRWGPRPIHDVKRDELITLIREKRSTPAEAHNLFGRASRLFGWARDQDYGLEINIAADIKLSAILGERTSRDRALSTEEIREVWNAVLTLPQPFRAAYQMLILTGLRLNECARGRRDEINSEAKTWTIPAARMKGKPKKAKPFVVPLTDRMIEILKALPRTGDFLFSIDGERPISLGSQIKHQLDAKLQPKEAWQNHDLRRTISTGLTGLGVKETVADAVLAHRKRGMEAVYNRYEYVKERRAALEKWGDHVAPDNVTPFPAQRDARAS